MRGFVFSTGIVFAAAGFLAAQAPSYTPGGVLQLPEYRDWVFLSSGLGMTYGPLQSATPPEHPSFENVFVTRAAYDAFRRSGKWPDKTMFILEIRASASEGSINKGGHFQRDIVGVESEVKDGDKWTFYAFGKGTEGKPLPRTESCYGCHSTNGAVDNTFVQFYPTLLPIATAKGTLRPAK